LHGYREIVFDYAVSPSRLPEKVRQSYEIIAMALQKLGESFLSHFDPDSLKESLEAVGWQAMEDCNFRELQNRYGVESLSEIHGFVRIVHARSE
jgi:O-methyltransferase involved in polyketide biosynthesis